MMSAPPAPVAAPPPPAIAPDTAAAGSLPVVAAAPRSIGLRLKVLVELLLVVLILVMTSE